MSNEVQVASSSNSNVALPSDVMSRLAQRAKDVAAKERPSVGKISLKSGVMTYAGAPMPGNKTDAVILCAAYRNVWYAGRFDANNVVNPNCFALSLSDEDMAPHANVSEPANKTCEGCKYNEWGSDPNGGRGKACKQTRRLILLPSSALKSVDDVKTAEFAILDLPVTSVKNYSGFVNALAASANVPTFAAVTEVSVVPDAKTQFKVKFQPMRVINDIDLILAIESRLEGAERLSIEPYDESATLDGTEEEAPAQAAAAAKKAKKF